MTFRLTITGALGALALCTMSCLGQTLVGLDGAEQDNSQNQVIIQTAKHGKAVTAKADKKIVVFTGDTIVPHIANGEGWRTSFTFINLENRTVRFQLLFLSDAGRDLYLPVSGQGTTRGLQITLAATASITFETTGAGALSTGWAYMLQDNSGDSIGGLAVFRQSVPGHADVEAVVPIVSQYNGHFVLLFDNQGFTTATALANPTDTAVSIPIVIRSETGAVLDRLTLQLPAFSHTAFTLPDRFASTRGRRGSIEFQSSGDGVGALGLRFGTGSFTSFHVLTNFDWL